jgi:hypothetical protein
MRFMVAMYLVLALACAAMLFPGEVADFILWMEEWWADRQS